MSALIQPSAPILLFDSGVGGLTVLAELRKLLPHAPVVYAADNAGLPYGEKTEAQVAVRVAGLLGRMTERFQPRLACIACNTASTIALEMVREVLAIPIVGTVPAIKPAADMTRTGVIGLLGTQATIRQGYVDRLEARFSQGKTLLRLAAPELVEAAEAKLRGEAIDSAAIRPVRRCAARASGRRSHRHRGACLHPLSADRARTGRRLRPAGALRPWRARHRAAHRLADRGPDVRPRRAGSGRCSRRTAYRSMPIARVWLDTDCPASPFCSGSKRPLAVLNRRESRSGVSEPIAVTRAGTRRRRRHR